MSQDDHIKLKDETNRTRKAGCVVVNDKREILLVTLRGESIWTFPKGHVEPGESPEQTALREVEEETGYQAAITRQLPDLTYTHGQTGELIRVALFQARLIAKTGEAEVQTECAWFSPEAAREALYYNLKHVVDEIEFVD